MAQAPNPNPQPTAHKENQTETGSMATFTETLNLYKGYQLFRLTQFYRDRIEQAIEEDVEAVSSLLTRKEYFSHEEHQKLTELTNSGRKRQSSKLLLNLVLGKDSRLCRVLWESFMEISSTLPKLNKIMAEIQEQGANRLDQVMIDERVPEVPSSLRDVQRLHKEKLREQTEKLEVNTILIKEKVKRFLLVDRYTELTIISDLRHRELVEHELPARGRDHDEWRQKQHWGELEKIRPDELFHSSFSSGRQLASSQESDLARPTGTSAVVSGVAGIGKTTMVQKIVHDWATSKIYPHFHFVFVFKFRDLNRIHSRTSLSNLILEQYAYLRDVLDELWKHPETLLFLFDGLDEFRAKIDFSDNRRDTEPQRRCTDPVFLCDVPDIMYSLIQRKLLPGCSVLLTSRPTALQLLAKAQVSVWAEILGFVGEERKQYFYNFFEDQEVAVAVYSHLEEYQLLFTMCYNPSYCWILAQSLGPFFTGKHRHTRQVPKTITQLFSYYIYHILTHHSVEIQSPRDVMVKIGEMAFTGVSHGNIVFSNEDLINYNLQPVQFLSGFLVELVERECSEHSVVYTFPHFSVQEFVAALAQFMPQNPGNLRRLLNEAHREKDGRFVIFLRFVAGLTSPRAANPLEEFLGPFVKQTTRTVISWLKETVATQIRHADTFTGKRNLLNTLHYLFESQNQDLAQLTQGSVQSLTLGGSSTDKGLTLTPIDCVVLSQAIGLCDRIKLLDLRWCHVQAEGLQLLAPVLHKFQVLLLGGNDLRDSGVKSLCESLSNPECKIQTLRLDSNSLTDSCTDDLVSALSTKRSLRKLDLECNYFTDASVPALLRLTLICNSLERIWLYSNSLTDGSTDHLFSALTTSRLLSEVYLEGNSFTDVAPSSVPSRSRLQMMPMVHICYARKHSDHKFQPFKEAAHIYKDQVTCQPSVPWKMYRKLQQLMILCLRNLSCDFGHYVRELQPITDSMATLCTDSQCEANRRWVRESQQYYNVLPWHGKESLNKRLSVAQTFIRSNNDRSGNIQQIYSNSKLYNDLLQMDREALVQLGASLEAAESLDVVKVDLETLANLCSDLPFANLSVHSHADRLLTQPSISSYTALLRCIKMQVSWCKREFLHALLLSIKTKSHQVETFHSFRGNEILLPAVINSNWAKKLKTVKLLLHKHVFKQEMSLNRVIWCSHTEVEVFLKTLSASGYPHIAQELGKSMGSSKVIRFREERPQRQTYKKIDGGPFITDLSTKIYSETQPPKLKLHAKHWIPRTANAITDYCHNYCREPSLSDPWLFRMAGALASEWNAVARDFGFSQSDIEKAATDPWYSHQQRMFHLLHRLTHEQKMSLTELCFLLLCKGSEYKCHRQIQDIIGAALSAVDLQEDVDLYSNVGEKAVQQQQQQQQNYFRSKPLTSAGCPIVWKHIKVLGHKRLRLVCDQWTEVPEMKELTPKVFDSFRDHVSLVGPVFDVDTQTKRTKVMVFLPTYTPIEAELSPTALAQNLLTLLSVTHQDVRNDLCEKLEAVLSEEEETKLFTFLLQEDSEAAVRLILSKGQRAAQVLCEYHRTSGSGMRSWPTRHHSLMETSPRQIGHIQDGNLELVVPLSVLERHLLLFTESLSPVAVIEKIRRLFTRRDAYCLLYKPVGRQYIDCRVTLKVFLIPRNGLFVGELDNKLKGYKQVFIANIKVEPSVRYRLTFQNISSDNPLLCVTPREGSEYQNALTDKDPISEYLITLNGEDWDKWPLVLQITGETDSVIFEKIIEEEMLKLENAEYFTLKLDDNIQCVMRIHLKVSYREFSHKLNTMFPDRKLSVYYTWNGIPLLVNNDDSIKMILREQCEKDIFLRAEDIVPTAEAQVIPRSSHKPVSFRRPSPTDQHWLVRHRTALVNRISDIKGILDELIKKDVINDNEYQRIRSQVCANEKNTCTLDCIIKKGEEAMDIFYESLAEKEPYLFQDLQSSEAS